MLSDMEQYTSNIVHSGIWMEKFRVQSPNSIDHCFVLSGTTLFSPLLLSIASPHPHK